MRLSGELTLNEIQRVTVLLALCVAGASAWAQSPTVSGRVVGNGYYQGALVCLDVKHNGRCDPAEPSVRSDANGNFTLSDERAGNADVIAVVGQDAKLYAVGGSTWQPVRRTLLFRSGRGVHLVLSAVSTEVQAIDDVRSGDAKVGAQQVAERLGITVAQLQSDPNVDPGSVASRALFNEIEGLNERIADAVEEAGRDGDLRRSLRNRLALDRIQTVVVIYAENRSFDNLFGHFPGAENLDSPNAHVKQLDRDATTLLANLPPAWGGLTAPGQTPVVSQAQTTNVWPNGPFQIDALRDQFGYGVVPSSIITHDLYHRFFENQMQIDGGRNDMFAAWSDAGGLSMGYFDMSKSEIWSLARRYTLADHFFQGAFGGSFLNHQYLICACAPSIPAAVVMANKMSINVLSAPVNGSAQLASASTPIPSALDAPPVLKTGNIAPLDYFGAGDGYRAVNTMQPAYQPSYNAPADNKGNDALFADPAASTTVPPQTQATIGDLLSARGINWAWYAGGWVVAQENPFPYDPATGKFGASTTIYDTNSFSTADPVNTDFQSHHQPFNYFAAMDPVAHPAYRTAHLKDRAALIDDALKGTLPAVVFYKPVGLLNQHPGYSSLVVGDGEIAHVVDVLQHSPQWPHMLILVTYDEFGGQFDHVAPPKGDLMGPGTRIPAVIISPFARTGYVDHTQYDTASFMRFVAHRFSLPILSGIQGRDTALIASGSRPMGDLTNALDFQDWGR
jgi:acid phosphatase